MAMNRLRLREKSPVVTLAEKIAKAEGVERQIGMFRGGDEIRIGMTVFETPEIEQMLQQDEKTATRVIRRALGVAEKL